MCWVCSPQLESLTYTADCTAALHAVVMVLPSLTQLSALSLTARGFAIPPETARLIGRLPLLSLRLDSAVYESQVRPKFTSIQSSVHPRGQFACFIIMPLHHQELLCDFATDGFATCLQALFYDYLLRAYLPRHETQNRFRTCSRSAVPSQISRARL